ncbi:PTS-dependent dihydroxyacetone kinase phosphotransferase subunit DhaM [Actinomadura nitritigenes]|uniref:phosphoenolpyruvate--glycerone phosphotransferase n=1 Tax=Actinomadura nitritigenes TaxID=134602 RepID=A0ABS3RBQ3_9ACTN|nr:PTS-dependent dihydroxyacetone kinase phosphotransferase subunit DhaM [Actinomadura nitritigenes]
MGSECSVLLTCVQLYRLPIVKNFVGIVLVSHSPLLAAGLADLLGQISGGGVPIAVAGGTEDGRIGTSYALIREAIAKVDQGAGVAVLPDLGSSVLTTRTVLEDHPDPTVVMVDAPFVEGALSAAVTAVGGADLTTVITAAQEARLAHKF